MVIPALKIVKKLKLKILGHIVTKKQVGRGKQGGVKKEADDHVDMDKFENNVEEKLKFNNSSKPKQDIHINVDKKMNIINGYVIIDDQKIEGAMCQETD